MKLIIDIPEETVNEIKDNAMFAETIASQIKWDVTSAIVNAKPLDDLRAEIEQLHHHPKLDFINNDEVVEMALDIIDKYREGEQE